MKCSYADNIITNQRIHQVTMEYEIVTLLFN